MEGDLSMPHPRVIKCPGLGDYRLKERVAAFSMISYRPLSPRDTTRLSGALLLYLDEFLSY
jgi:hypothetical protein